ncbi:hypothetical protein D5400_12495 [Georhizobium profundi]|uniref:Uncharacterized protein n=1 Tax=Georhizobium profundi TaxID=2341112 RepID=A0A3Q8XPK3_9HYPH|nr:hypothetical protein [Georhizobium profundi]AZN71985.1 hypothetical protein D5400_12495 [Georhizobium profundi]
MKARFPSTSFSLVDACLGDIEHPVRRPANDETLPPMVVPTEEGKQLAAMQTKSITDAVLVTILAGAIFAIGFAMGQLTQQTIMDARAYEVERRV